jgi:mono/diheme cytochrome c family protein
MKQISLTATALLLAGTSMAQAEGAHDGKALHEKYCAGCHMIPHDATFYQRPERKTQSYEKLQGMVRFCDANLGTQLFDEDMTAIGDYLNDTYYKFPKN